MTCVEAKNQNTCYSICVKFVKIETQNTKAITIRNALLVCFNSVINNDYIGGCL